MLKAPETRRGKGRVWPAVALAIFSAALLVAASCGKKAPPRPPGNPSEAAYSIHIREAA
jgi:hypothetical protein